METIIADGIAYERVFPLYPGEYDPPPTPPTLSSRRAAAISLAKTCGLTAPQRVERAMQLGAKTKGQMLRRLSMSGETLQCALDQLMADGRVKCEVKPPRISSDFAGHHRSVTEYRLVRDDL